MKLVLLGAGGHACVLLDSILAQPDPPHILGCTDPQLPAGAEWYRGCVVMGTDEETLPRLAEGVSLVNGIASTRRLQARRLLYDHWRATHSFCTVLDPTAHVSPTARLGAGVQVLARTVINGRTSVGENSIVNTGTIVEHDCIIGAHVHLAPAVVLSGGVRIGEETHVGTGAVVIQGVNIGRRCLIGAGSVVIRDVPDGTIVYGVPARANHRGQGEGL